MIVVCSTLLAQAFQMPTKNVVVQSFSKADHTKLLDAAYKSPAGYLYDNRGSLHKEPHLNVRE